MAWSRGCWLAVALGSLLVGSWAAADEGSGVSETLVLQGGSRGVGDVIRSIPAAGADNRGLAFDGTSLWQSEDDTAAIYELDPVDGSVLSFFFTPGGPFKQGVAWDGTYLWHAGSDGGVYKLQTDGTVMGMIIAPTTLPCGLAWDGTHLWTSSYLTDTIYRFDATGALDRSFVAPAGDPWGVAWCGGQLWHAQLNGGWIYQLDPSDGSVITSFPPPAGTSITGIECGSGGLWAVDRLAALIYLIDNGSSVIFADDFESGDTSVWSATVPKLITRLARMRI